MPRNNKRSPKIYSLLEKRKKKLVNPTYQEGQYYAVGDEFNTLVFVPKGKDPEKVINKHLESRKKFKNM